MRPCWLRVPPAPTIRRLDAARERAWRRAASGSVLVAAPARKDVDHPVVVLVAAGQARRSATGGCPDCAAVPRWTGRKAEGSPFDVQQGPRRAAAGDRACSSPTMTSSKPSPLMSQAFEAEADERDEDRGVDDFAAVEHAARITEQARRCAPSWWTQVEVAVEVDVDQLAGPRPRAPECWRPTLPSLKLPSPSLSSSREPNSRSTSPSSSKSTACPPFGTYASPAGFDFDAGRGGRLGECSARRC